MSHVMKEQLGPSVVFAPDPRAAVMVGSLHMAQKIVTKQERLQHSWGVLVVT